MRIEQSDDDEIVYVRHDDLPSGLVNLLGLVAGAVGMEGGYEAARGAETTGAFDVPVSSVGDPQSVYIQMVAPALFTWDTDAETALLRGNVARFTYTSALEMAIDIAAPFEIDLDFDDMYCKGECCDDLLDAFNEFVTGAIAQSWSRLIMGSAIQGIRPPRRARRARRWV